MQPRDPGFADKVRASFDRQPLMSTIGAQLESVLAGEVVISFPFHDRFTQQHGFMHGGIVASVIDTACGYAALSLLAAGTAVLTVEFKINLVAPASGDRFVSTGRVVRSGKTLSVCTGEMVAERAGGAAITIAVMQATIMAVQREGMEG